MPKWSCPVVTLPTGKVRKMYSPGDCKDWVRKELECSPCSDKGGDSIWPENRSAAMAGMDGHGQLLADLRLSLIAFLFLPANTSS